jgi:hypothetical protein
MPVADMLSAAVRLADKLVHEQPRNLDIAWLRYSIRQLAATIAPPRPAPYGKKAKRRPPHYWRDQKRRRRAREKANRAGCAAPSN